MILTPMGETKQLFFWKDNVEHRDVSKLTAFLHYQDSGKKNRVEKFAIQQHSSSKCSQLKPDSNSQAHISEAY